MGWFSLLLAFLFLAGCVSKPETFPPRKVIKPLVWPPPPQRARITFLQEISFPRDIRRAGGWWSRIKEIASGRSTPTIIRPYGITLDPEENLLIADPGAHRIHIYHLPDRSYRSLPSRKDPLVLLTPIGVATDGEGRIYVSDSEAGKVYLLNRKGRFTGTLGEFQRPTGLTINRSLSRVYVVDTGKHRVRVYRTAGTHLFDFGKRGGGPAEFNYPTNICLDGRGNVYITDSMNFRVQAFDPDGHFLYTFGIAGDGPGAFSKPRGIGVDSDGHIYVADATFDNIQILNRKGRALLAVGSSGMEPGQFYMPSGLFIDARDRIFVADSYNKRIQVFQYLHKQEEHIRQTQNNHSGEEGQSGNTR